MRAIALYLIIILLIGAVAIIIGVMAYRKRLDKVARGELRDTHSAIPDPSTTANGVYKVVLIVIVAITLIYTSSLHARITDLTHQISNLNSTIEVAQRELFEYIEQSEKNVASMGVSFSDVNSKDHTVKIHFSTQLKEFSDDTEVALNVGDKNIKLDRSSNGTYEADFTGGIFDNYGEATLHIKEGNKTSIESIEYNFPDWIFWDVLPVPGLQMLWGDSSTRGKTTGEESWLIHLANVEDIESVSVTYVTGGLDYKTIDATSEVINDQTMAFEKGIPTNQDLALRIEIITKSGFKITSQQTVIWVSDSEDAVGDFLTIQDLDGNVLYDMR